MFKIESYITPIILSYVDKYIKNLKPEDSQVSLWGGDAVFNNLDLRLDVLEQELGTPFSFVNGHIHELRIHVPWTKLGSEPVVITINTIECILKLSEDVSSDSASSSGDHGTGSSAIGSIKVRGEPKVAGKPLDSNTVPTIPPPNYVQSLINRVINNISIICNNVILKYVEDDIVLSLNAKSVEVFSTNNQWIRAFVDLSLPELVLRKVIRLVDLTVCLDRRDASGKISIYQDPLLYRCSLDCRLHLAFESLYGNRLLTTKFDIMCDQLDFSVTDHQLTMFLRLIELGLALQANEIPTTQTRVQPKEDTTIEPANSEVDAEGWSSWLWSYIPSGMSVFSERDSTDEKQLSSPVFHFGLYVKKASYMFKVEESVSDVTGGFNSRKINFRPLFGLIIEAQYIDAVTRGIDVFNLRMGFDKVTGIICGNCSCGVNDSQGSEKQFFVAGARCVDGDRELNSSHNLFIRDSLFDEESIENSGQHREYYFDWDQHFHHYSKDFLQTKTSALAMDYFYLLEIPEDISEKSSGISVTDLENSSLKERANVRIFIAFPTLDISSSVIHRYQTIIASSTPYEYEPYVKQKEETAADSHLPTSAEDVSLLEKFIPYKMTTYSIMQPQVRLFMADHSKTVEATKSGCRKLNKKSSEDIVNLDQLPIISVVGKTLEIQQRVPLYPKRLVKIVSVLRTPSDFLISNCHYKFGAELKDGSACLLYDRDKNEVTLPFIEPCQIIWRIKTLLLPQHWKNPVQSHSENSIEIGDGCIISTSPQLMLLKMMWSSWFDTNWRMKYFLESSVVQDTFAKKTGTHGTSLKLKLSDLKWKKCINTVLLAHSLSLGFVAIFIEHIDNKREQHWVPVFSGPQLCTAAYTLDYFNTSNVVIDQKDSNDNPFFHFVLQIPLNFDSILTPVAFYFNVRNAFLCLDSRMLNWISYRPFVRNIRDPIMLNYPLSESLENDDFSKESKGSAISIGGTKSETTTSCYKRPNQNRSSAGSMKFISDWYPVLQKMTIHFYIEGVQLFLCNDYISWPYENYIEHRKLVNEMRQMVLNRRNPQLLVINVPMITILNEGNKTSLFSNQLNIPIISSIGSDKFPWSVRIERYSVFTLDSSYTSYLLAPDVVAATIAINSKSGHLNLTQLNVCIHCDFQPVHLHLSQPQAKLLVLINKNYVARSMSFLSMICSSGSIILTQPANPWHPSYDLTVDERKSRKTSGASSVHEKEKSTLDASSVNLPRLPENDVKVSLWLQTTLPKLVLDIVDYHQNNINIRICCEMEDVTCAFDVQEVYSKIKLKVASVKATNFTSTGNEWKLGDFGGITFSSGQAGRLLYATTITKGELTHDLGSKLGELPGSFLTATFTRVQRKNVQKRWSKIMKERLKGDDSSVNHTIGFATDASTKFISEIDLKLLPMEFVFQVPVLKCIVNVSRPLCDFISSTAVRQKSTGALPSISTANLALIYFSCTEVNIFFPNSTINESKDIQFLKPNDDVIVLQVNSIDLTPNADNPLSRIVLKPDIYNVAQRAGILKIPGSEIEDRQYQIDVKGLALSTGVWEYLLKSRTTQSREMNYSTTMGENPAVEWNLKSSSISDNFPKTSLCPLFSSFDLRIVAAPAIVYENERVDSQQNDSIIAGHSLEVNVATTVTIYCGVHQLDLLLDTLYLMESSFKYNSSNVQSSDLNPKTVIREMDSGIESEANSSPALLLNSSCVPPPLNIIPGLSPLNPHLEIPQLGLSATSKSLITFDTIPFEILLTAGLITVASYFPENYINVPNNLQFPKRLNDRLHSTTNVATEGGKLRKRYQSPERASSSSEESNLKIKHKFLKNKSKDVQDLKNDATIGYDASVESSDEDICVIQDLSYGIVPLFYVIISQPYTLIKYNRGCYKMELSCFDINIKGVTALRSIQCDARLPKPQYYNAAWLETVHGDPDSKTGIHPSFYTLTIIGHTSKKPTVILKVERPVRFIWDNWKLLKLSFLLSNLNIFKNKKPTSVENSSPVEWKKWMCLVDEIQCSTKQIVVVIETVDSNNCTARVVCSINSCSSALSFSCENMKDDDVTNASMSFSVKGCLVKTQLIDPEPRVFVGPFSIAFESSVTWEKWTSLPIILMKLAMDTLFVNLDKSHLHCLNLVVNNVLAVINSDNSNGSNDFTWLFDFNQGNNIFQTWQDDLRVGVFQYTQNLDDVPSLPSLPGPNEIVFRKENGGFGASMTWKYSEPRALIRTEIHPVPFRVTNDDATTPSDKNEKLQSEVSCALQYWDQLLASFVTYRVFCLSETEPCILDLPMANIESRRELVVSSMWRVLMNYSDDYEVNNEHTKRGQCALSPLALAACMRVDSCFRPALVPSIQFRFTLDIMKITFRNYFPSTEDVVGKYCDLAPFKLDGTMPSYQEFLVLSLENLTFFDQHWHEECKAELELIMRLETIDYYFLSLQPLMDPSLFKSQLLISHDSSRLKLYEFEFLVNINSIFLHLEPQSLYTLTTACTLWAENEEVQKEHYLPCAFLICNNTLETIRFGQIDTDENIVLRSQQAHAYSWRTAKCKQVIHVCVEGMRWKWCEPFSINQEGVHVFEVENENRKITLVIHIKQLTPIQMKVTINGQVTIASRLNFPIAVRIQRNNRLSSLASEEIVAVVPACGFLPSLITQCDDSLVLQMRAVTVNPSKECNWSNPISVDSIRNLSSIQIIDNNGKEINFWCKVFKQPIGVAVRQLMLLSPMYIVRSHLPQQLSMEIVTPSLADLVTVFNLEGKSKEQHIFCPGQPNIQHNVKFRLNVDSMPSSPTLPLTPYLGNQKAAEPSIDIDLMCENYKISNLDLWPYDNLEEQQEVDTTENRLNKMSVTVDLPELQLEISMKQCWLGCEAILIDVKPWGLIANRSNLDCVLIFTKNMKEASIIIPAQTIVALPKLTMAVKLGITYSGDTYSSRSFFLNGYDDGWFTQKISTRVFQHLDIHISTPNTKVCFLTFCRMENFNDIGMHVFTIRSRYSVVNLSRSTLAFLPFALLSNELPLNLDMTNNVVVESKSEETELMLWEGVWKLGELQKECVPHMKIGHLNLESQWSTSFRLTSEEEVIGSHEEKVYSVVVPSSTPDNLSSPYCVTCQDKLGSVVILVTNDDTPQLLLHNRCPVSLFIAQGSSQPPDDGAESLVGKEYLNAFVNEIPVVEPFSSLYYTLPFVTQKFPQMYDPSMLPRLHLAEDSSKTGSGLEWSGGIQLTSEVDQFITIPNCGDVKVHLKKISATTNVFLDPINRIEISAKEIRSRIKRRTGEATSQLSTFPVAKYSRASKSTTSKPKWRAEEVEETPLFAISPILQTFSMNNEWSLYGRFHVSHICFILSGNAKEIIRINVDHFQVVTRSVSDASPSSKSSLNLNKQNLNFLQELIICVGDLQVDNQLTNSGGHDFPVVLLRQNDITDVNWDEISSARRNSLMTIATVIEGSKFPNFKCVVKDVEISIQSIAIYAEDSLLYAILELMKSIQWSLSHSNSSSINQLQPSSTLIVRRLVVHPISLLLSLRVSTKLFISFDHTPLNFKAFERAHVWTTWHRLGHTLAVHYISGALVCAGWVIGSMDLLANPGGFARAVGTGFFDLFRLPYRGLMNGPWAFVAGIVQGTSSLINHIGSGTVLSITNLASSISRNMDYISMDNVHLERNEELRRSPPQGLTAGLSQGLTGLGISLLGAMAGIVHQPLQSIHEGATERPLTRTAAGILSGVGKGLVGIVVKPIGGAAEFVAQAGQGILHGAGWIRVHKPRYEPVVNDIINNPNSQLKFIWKMLPNSRSPNDLILAIEATHVSACGTYIATSLLLTTEIIFVVSLDSDSQQQAFGLAELECHGSCDDPTLVTFFTIESTDNEYLKGDTKQTDRIAEFVDRTSKYTAKGKGAMVDRVIIDESESSSSSSSYRPDPWKCKAPTTPSYNFYLHPRLRDTFIMCYDIAQRKLLGKGFK